MKAYWLQLKPRERIIIIASGIILGVLFIYLLVLEPQFEKTERLTLSIAKQEKLLTWIKEASSEARQLQRTNNLNGVRPVGQSLLGLIDRTAKAGNLSDSMKRVEPDGSTRVRVWLEQASFDDITRWLETLERQYGLKVNSVVIDKEELPGRVNARLIFEGQA